MNAEISTPISSDQFAEVWWAGYAGRTGQQKIQGKSDKDGACINHTVLTLARLAHVNCSWKVSTVSVTWEPTVLLCVSFCQRDESN